MELRTLIRCCLLPAVLPAVFRYGWNFGKTRKTELDRLTPKDLVFSLMKDRNSLS